MRTFNFPFELEFLFFFSQNEDPAVERICYNTMRHEEGDEEVAGKQITTIIMSNYLHHLDYQHHHPHLNCDNHHQVTVKDCILLASGPRKKDLPYVAKVNSLWENPEDGNTLLLIILTKQFLPS